MRGVSKSGSLKIGYIRFKSNIGVDDLASEFVVDTDDGGLGDALVGDQSGLYLSGGQTVARDIDDIWIRLSPSSVKWEPFEKLTVHTTLDPNVSVLIT